MSFTKCLHGCKTLGGQPKGFHMYRTYQAHMVSMHPREEVMNEDGSFHSDKKQPQQSNPFAAGYGRPSSSNEYVAEEDMTNYDDYYDRKLADINTLFEKLKIKVKKLEKRVKELEGDDDEEEEEVVHKSATKSVMKA